MLRSAETVCSYRFLRMCRGRPHPVLVSREPRVYEASVLSSCVTCSAGFRVHAFLDPNLIGLDDFVIRVAQQWKGETMFFDEFLVTFNAIAADAEKLHFRLEFTPGSRNSQAWAVHPGVPSFG
jgi:hypothetical protein